MESEFSVVRQLRNGWRSTYHKPHNEICDEILSFTKACIHVVYSKLEINLCILMLSEQINH